MTNKDLFDNLKGVLFKKEISKDGAMKLWQEKAFEAFIRLDKLITGEGITPDITPNETHGTSISLVGTEVIVSSSKEGITLYWLFRESNIFGTLPHIEARVRLIVGPGREKGSIDVIYDPKNDKWYGDHIFANNSPVTKALKEKFPVRGFFSEKHAVKLIRGMLRAFKGETPYYVDYSTLPS